MVFNAHPERRQLRGHGRARLQRGHLIARPASRTSPASIEKPTLDSFNAICKDANVKLLLVTGGPVVVKAAMQTGKRAICAGPGNPPVFVDDTCCPTRAAQGDHFRGGAYDNNLLCIGEKEVFVLDTVADKLMAEMEKNGAVKLNASQLDRLTKAAFTFKEGQGGGCAHASVNKDFIGKDASVLAQAAGVNMPAGHAVAVCARPTRSIRSCRRSR